MDCRNLAVFRSGVRPGLWLFLAFLLASIGARAATLTIAWDRSPDAWVTGYAVYWRAGDAPYARRDVGNVTTNRFLELVAGVTYSFYVTSYDANGTESDPSNFLTYTPPLPPPPPPPPSNHPPVFDPIPNQTVLQAQTLALTVRARDPDAGQQVQLRMLQGPPRATFNPATGAFSFSPGSSDKTGTNRVIIVATDNGNPSMSTTQSFTVVNFAIFYLTVNPSPLGKVDFSPVGASTKYGFKCLDGDVVTFRATPNPGAVLQGWMVDCLLKKGNPLTVTMNRSHTVEPIFALVNGGSAPSLQTTGILEMNGAAQQVTIRNGGGMEGVLEFSEDLIHWTPVFEGTFPGSISTPFTNRAGYFRVQEP